MVLASIIFPQTGITYGEVRSANVSELHKRMHSGLASQGSDRRGKSGGGCRQKDKRHGITGRLTDRMDVRSREPDPDHSVRRLSVLRTMHTHHRPDRDLGLCLLPFSPARKLSTAARHLAGLTLTSAQTAAKAAQRPKKASRRAPTTDPGQQGAAKVQPRSGW